MKSASMTTVGLCGSCYGFHGKLFPSCCLVASLGKHGLFAWECHGETPFFLKLAPFPVSQSVSATIPAQNFLESNFVSQSKQQLATCCVCFWGLWSVSAIWSSSVNVRKALISESGELVWASTRSRLNPLCRRSQLATQSLKCKIHGAPHVN